MAQPDVISEIGIIDAEVLKSSKIITDEVCVIRPELILQDNLITVDLNNVICETDIIKAYEVEVESETITEEVCETTQTVLLRNNHVHIIPDRELVTLEEEVATKFKEKDIVEEAMEDLFADSDLEEDPLPPEELLLNQISTTTLPIRNDRTKMRLQKVELGDCVRKARLGRRKVDDSEKSTVERQLKESKEFRATLERRPAKGDEIKDSRTFEEVQKVMAKRRDGHRCVTCQEIFLTRRALNVHMKTHSTDGESFQCPECSRSFNQSCNLRRHMRSHSGDRPFVCPDCGKCFSDQGYLATHKRYHSDERPYVCAVCAKEFVDRSNFVKHTKAHAGEKRHACTLCPMAFVQLSDLTRHVRVHTGARPFECEACGRRYQQAGDLAQHKRQHSGERPFSCRKCQRTFANKRYLQGHERLRVCCKAKPDSQAQTT